MLGSESTVNEDPLEWRPLRIYADLKLRRDWWQGSRDLKRYLLDRQMTAEQYMRYLLGLDGPPTARTHGSRHRVPVYSTSALP